jgi:transposase
MRYISSLDSLEKLTLEEGFRNHTKHHFRSRCKSILMSDEGFSVPEIARFFKVRTRTIHTWFDRWESFGVSGLTILPGRGRRTVLNEVSSDEISIIEKAVSEHPQNLGGVCKHLQEQLGLSVTKKMLQRFLKKTRLFLETPQKSPERISGPRRIQ